MSIQDGFPVNAAYTNPRFISKNENDVMPFQLGFTYGPGGPSITSIQAAVNKLYTATGASESQTGTVYNATAGTITNGDDYETALTILANKFDAATGHLHSGTAGDGPLIPASSLTDFFLQGYLEQGTTISGASGTSTNVTSLLTGKTPSTSQLNVGVCVNTGPNKVRILSAATATGYRDVVDSLGNLVYGRLTESAGTWTLSYYSQILSVETAYSFAAPQNLFWWYQELFEPNGLTSVYNPTMDLFTAGGGGSGGGVTSVAASGFTPATGAIVLVEGTGIDLSQTGGNITIAVDPSALSPLTTKGDIFGYSSVNARIPVGLDGQDLIPDSNQTLGVRYADSVVKNYARINADADVSIGNWATFADAASNIPADGTGGSPNITWTRTTSSPLEGPGSFLFTKSGAANRQGQGASLAITLSNACQGQINAVQFDFKVVSGTFTAGNGITPPLNDGTTTTNAGNSDIEVFIYDVTNSALVPVTPQIITSNSTIAWQFKGTFQASSNSTSYRLIIYQATATTNDYTLQFDNFFVGRQAVSYGYAGTDWSAYTPTYTGVGTVSTNSAFWRRSGDSIEVQGFVTLGTVAGSLFSISLPAGISVNPSKLGVNNTTANPGQQIGVLGDSSATQSTGLYLVTAPATSTTIIYGGHRIGANNPLITPQNGNSIFSTGDVVSWSLRVPVSGWSSNVLMSNDSNSQIITFNAFKNGGSVTANADIPTWTTVNRDSSGSFNASTGVFTVPVSGDYQVSFYAISTAGTPSAIVTKNGANWAVGTGSAFQTGVVTLITGCVAGNTISARLDASVTLSSSNTQNMFSITKVTGPASIAASENIFLQYTNNAGTVLTANTTNIDFTTKVVDSSLAWSGTVFTAPRAGWYNIQGAIQITTNVNANTYLYKNTVQTRILGTTTNSTNRNFSGAEYLLAGDQISIRLSAGATLDNSVGAVLHWISITSQ